MQRRSFQIALWMALVGVTLGMTPLSALANGWLDAGHAYRHGEIARAIPNLDVVGRGNDVMLGHLSPVVRAVARKGEVAPLLGNLGTYHRQISTTNELAQKYFDEGLILTYGFNHAEAIRSYKDAITLDASCAMCYWGIALALGPNINAPMDPSTVPDALAALAKAQELAPGASASEQAYIRALGARYSSNVAPDADRAPLDRAYANEMKLLATTYPDDNDAVTLYAEALMDLSPWQYWTKDGKPTDNTMEIVSALQAVVGRAPDHPGANHYLIHATEASQTPELAIPSAERLEKLVPGAGHLTHMPAHTYWRVGRYLDAARVNETAITVDEATFRRGVTGADQGSHTFYALAYYPHNIHFLFAASHMSGRKELALTAARKLVSVIPAEAYKEVPGLEDFRPMPLFAMVRFGMWDEIMAEPAPPAEMQYTTGIWHWARGLAALRKGQRDAANTELAVVTALAKSDAMKQLTLPSFATAATMLEIASNILGGELAAADGKTDDAIMLLQQAVKIQDGLAYTEPPPWFYPARHNLGAVLLEANRPVEAEAVYREDLHQYPYNGWTLVGLSKSLYAQHKDVEATEIESRAAEALKSADVRITASRF